MNGKNKCKILKEIRQRIALENDIDLITSECSHKGDCSGTCPKCESEVRYLEREIEKRRALGKKIALVGLAAGVTFASACTPSPFEEEILEGDMQVSPPGELEEVVDTMGDLAPEDDIPFINEDGEEDLLMGEPEPEETAGVLPEYFIPEDISEYDGYGEYFINESLVGEKIETVVTLWGEPDFKQSSKDEGVYSYFAEFRDIKITFDIETGVIIKAETIDTTNA